jgi:hypothetical protein
MRSGERAGKRGSPQKIKPGNGDRVEIADRQIQRLVRAFRAIKSVRLRMNIVSFAESVALARTLRRHSRRGDRS